MPQSAAPRSLAQILAVIAAIPDQVSGVEQARALYELSAATTGRGLVVEVGTSAGKSTIALAYGQQIHRRAPMHSIGIVVHPELHANLARAGVQDYVRRSARGSDAAVRSWLAPIELLWVAGNHTYADVTRAIRNWSPHVIPGGILACRDYPAQGGGRLGAVGHAVHETLLARSDPWALYADAAFPVSMIAFQRLESGARSATPPGWRREPPPPRPRA